MGIASLTGLGNPAPAILHNTGKITSEIQQMFDDALKLYFDYWGGFDYDIEDTYIRIGYEPAYQYEEGLLIYIFKDKIKSYWERSKAWGAYGSELALKGKAYHQYKTNSKFVKFINKWHNKIWKDQQQK
jgi:hypothetical protein